MPTQTAPKGHRSTRRNAPSQGPARPAADPRHILVIGGGASGVLMAAHLLRRQGTSVRVTLLERDEFLGCGIAYGTDDPGHLLNNTVAQMSAYPDAPDHFARWVDDGIDPGAFVTRGTYSRYLTSLLDPYHDSGRLRCLRGECLTLRETPDGVDVTLADGRQLQADHAILATGHAVPAVPDAPLRGGWDFTPPRDRRATVAIVGTGLSMVDHVATLLAAGHTGPIYCLSRRGLLPQPHTATTALRLDRADVPLGAGVAATLRWLRDLVRRTEAAGGDWRGVVDGLRPHVAAIWQAWSQAERARFLRHGAAIWETHRHRMPPASAARIAAAHDAGQLHVHRAAFDGAEAWGGRITLSLTPRGPEAPERLMADHVVDCRGTRRNPAAHAVPVVQDLIARGAARLDPLRLGLDTTACAKLIGSGGTPSARIHAIGPAARGAIWEITAVPDIREQTAAIADHLMATPAAEPAAAADAIEAV